MSTSSFNFYNFLKDTTNPALVPLQDNEKYDTLLSAIAATFNTLYERVQLIKINNTLDLNEDLSYQNYLNDNEGSVSQNTILEYLATYLNTDHFKSTVAVLMRLYEYRSNNNQLENLDQFVERWIIPSFKFFTMNAGDLHKAKGTRGLLERLFEFYSKVGDSTQMFEGLIEHETEDTRDLRFNKFTSYRIGIDEVTLKRNYEDILALSDIQINQFFELNNHKYVQASGFLFVSEKDRDDWWIMDILDSMYKMDDDHLVIRRDEVIYLYSDDFEMYNADHEFVSPAWDEREIDVEFVPQIVNVKDPFNEYHNTNFYWIEKISNESDTFSDYLYNLKRWKNDDGDITLQTLKEGMGIGYEPLSFESNSESYPRINSILSVDFLWLDFHGDDVTSYEFDSEDVKMVYTFTYEYQFAKPVGTSSFEYPKEKMLAIARDGYDYDHDANGFYYTILSQMNDNNIQHYKFLERVLSSQFEQELYNLIGSKTINVRTAFDIFYVERKLSWIDNYFNFRGYWNADNEDWNAPWYVAPSLTDAFEVDSYTELLIPFDGVDGATTFIDSSPKTYSLISHGLVHLDTLTKKYGSASCNFNGSSDYITIASFPIFSLDDDNFSIDFWVRFNEITVEREMIFGIGDASNKFEIYRSSTLIGASLTKSDGSSVLLSGTPTGLLKKDTWYHVAITRNGENWNLYINGVDEASTTNSTISFSGISGDLYLGRRSFVPGSGLEQYLDGYLDELRFVKGKSLWDSEFTESVKTSEKAPEHGDYWIVSNDGEVELNGIKSWKIGDVVTWNANFGYWEKNNKVLNYTDGQQINWAIDHKIIALGEDQFIL